MRIFQQAGWRAPWWGGCLLYLWVAGATQAAVVNFDDLSGQDPLEGLYAGIDWGTGMWEYYDWPQNPYTPQSPPVRIFAYELEAPFSFVEDNVVFQGAFFSGESFNQVHFELFDSGNNLLWTSPELTPTDVPTWLSSGYSGVVKTVKVVSTDLSWVMDDVTYTPIPEASTLPLFGLGTLGLLVGRRRKNRF